MNRSCAATALAFALIIALRPASCDGIRKFPLEKSQVFAAGVPVQVVRVNLDDSRVRVSAQVARGCPSNSESFQTLVDRSKPYVAVNGAYFDPTTLKPIGDIVVDGKLVNTGLMGTALAITSDNRALIRRVEWGRTQDWSKFETVIASGPALVLNGKIDVDPSGEQFGDSHIMGSSKRMGVGLIDERHLLIVMTLKGVDFVTWAKVMKALDCKDAMNLDAGASLGMYYKGNTIVKPGRKLTNLLTVHMGAARTLTSSASSTSEARPIQDTTTLAMRVLGLINEQRERVNAPLLRIEPRLARAAEEYAHELALAKRLSHRDEHGREAWDRLRAKGYDYSACGENLACAGSLSEPGFIISMWMNSLGHQRNMLNPDFHDAGLGRAADAKGTSYWVLVLGRSSTESVTVESIRPADDKTDQPGTVRHDSGGNPVVPLVFPVLANVKWTDTFGADRDGGRRKHQGQDLLAPKMTPLVACFDGIVYVGRSLGVGGHNTLSIRGDNGFSATYMHVNNDTPGTNDGLGTAEFAFPAGLRSGERVVAGQLVAWVGDSGNAEGGPAHCHFELYGEGKVFNAAASLRAARHVAEPVVRLDSPDSRPASGEIKLDGIVRTVDSERKVAQIDLLASTRSDGIAHSIRRPEKLWIKLENCRIEARGDGSRACEVQELSAGMPVSVIGKAVRAGESIPAKELSFAAPLPPPAEIVAANTITPQSNLAPKNNPSSASGSQVLDQAGVAQPESQRSMIIRRLLSLVNEARLKARLKELTWNDSLAAAARAQSRGLASSGHAGIGLTADRIKRFGYEAEVLAEVQDSSELEPEGLVDRWMTQGGMKRRSLLDRRYEEVGIEFETTLDAANPAPIRRWAIVLACPSRH